MKEEKEEERRKGFESMLVVGCGRGSQHLGETRKGTPLGYSCRSRAFRAQRTISEPATSQQQRQHDQHHDQQQQKEDQKESLLISHSLFCLSREQKQEEASRRKGSVCARCLVLSAFRRSNRSRRTTLPDFCSVMIVMLRGGLDRKAPTTALTSSKRFAPPFLSFPSPPFCSCQTDTRRIVCARATQSAPGPLPRSRSKTSS